MESPRSRSLSITPGLKISLTTVSGETPDAVYNRDQSSEFMHYSVFFPLLRMHPENKVSWISQRVCSLLDGKASRLPLLVIGTCQRWDISIIEGSKKICSVQSFLTVSKRFKRKHIHCWYKRWFLCCAVHNVLWVLSQGLRRICLLFSGIQYVSMQHLFLSFIE